MGTGGPISGGKARPGRDADHTPPSSAEIKNEWELSPPPPNASMECSRTAYLTNISKNKMSAWNTNLITSVERWSEVFEFVQSEGISSRNIHTRVSQMKTVKMFLNLIY
jgi:hypothetical protein